MPLGEVIAILVDDPEDIAAFANYTGDASEPAPAQAAPAQAAPAKPAAPAKSYPDHIVLDMPNLSPTMEKGNISTWNKKVGDKVTPGEALCGIETDKAVVDFEMQEEGFVAKILYSDGAKDVPLGEPIAILVDDEDDIAAFADWTPGAGSAPAEEAPAQQAPAQQATSAAPQQQIQKSSGDRKFVSPLAKKTANEKGVDLSSINGTGPNDRIILADVEDALKAGPVKVAKDVEVKKVASAPTPAPVDMPNDMF